MSSQTKIIVIKQKNLLTGAILAAIIMLIIILLLVSNPSDEKPVSPQTTPPVTHYTAGVYSSTVVLNGNPVEIKVTVDTDTIHNISTSNLSESVETVFPLFQSCFDDITTQIISNNSTENITYNSDNQYTSLVLIESINQALSKASD